MKVALDKIIYKMNLERVNENIDTSSLFIEHSDVNRPALQITGFFDYFDNDRIQIIGHIESTYMKTMNREILIKNLTKMFELKIPCLIYSRNIEVPVDILELANEYNIPILRTGKPTSEFMAEIIRILRVELAPTITIHGVLIDVYGEGVLITGESGIGKSEAALELIKRGHRLVADDAVEIKKVSDETLIGTSPDITKHFIEVRGIGIINVKSMFGVSSIKETHSINLVINLEEWDRYRDYDRIGLEDRYTEYLGNKVVCYSLPIRPGRNLAIIVEAAAINFRSRMMGHNAAKELHQRIEENTQKRREEINS